MAIGIVVKSAVVHITNGPDKVSLETELPCPYCEEYLPSQPALELTFDATFDTGVDYCRRFLGIEPEVVDLRTHYRR
jgi:hypothetical protein